MKKIKGLFLFIMVFVLLGTINVNADTSAGQYFVSEGSNILRAGEVVKVKASIDDFNEKENILELKYDSNVFELIDKEPYQMTQCFKTEIASYTDNPNSFIAKIERVEEIETHCSGRIAFEYYLKVKKVNAQNTEIRFLRDNREYFNPIRFLIVKRNESENKDFKSGLYYLRGLSVEGHNFNFPGSYSDFDKHAQSIYHLTVDNNVDSIYVQADPEDINAKVYGTGKKSLEVGKNLINILVVAENGDTLTYTITAYRKNKDGNVIDELVKEYNPTPNEENNNEQEITNNAEPTVSDEQVTTVTDPKENKRSLINADNYYLFILIGFLIISIIILLIFIYDMINDDKKENNKKEKSE